jgi:hypothetical protein
VWAATIDGSALPKICLRKERVMSVKKQLLDLAVSDTGFVFDPFTGSTFTVNQTGLCVLQAFKEGLDKKRAVQRIRERFNVRAGDPLRDVDEFVQLLRQNGVVPGDFSAS